MYRESPASYCAYASLRHFFLQKKHITRIIFNFWITYFLLEKETKERGLVLRTFRILLRKIIYRKGRQDSLFLRKKKYIKGRLYFTKNIFSSLISIIFSFFKYFIVLSIFVLIFPPVLLL